MTRKKIEPDKKRLRLKKVVMGRGFHKKREYEAELKELQVKLLRIQQAYFHQGRRAVLVFEGWDAAGKGGAIRRLTEKLDGRGVTVHAISAPTPEEQGKHYLYRFWKRLPPKGTFAIFDRSWYGRVLVEKVEGFATPAEVARAYDEMNEFEHTLIDDGVRVVKVFLHITPEEQLARFGERLENPHKRWKLTDEDLRNRAQWDGYADAIEKMFDKTSTKQAPWHLIAANWKWTCRVAVLRTVVEALGEGVDLEEPRVDPAVLETMRKKLGLGSARKRDAAQAEGTAGRARARRREKDPAKEKAKLQKIPVKKTSKKQKVAQKSR
jgi:AMP-polyphosphate phosphotransferase